MQIEIIKYEPFYYISIDGCKYTARPFFTEEEARNSEDYKAFSWLVECVNKTKEL